MNVNQQISNALTGKPDTVVYSCSGCSDAGELADSVARRLAREGSAEMSCLAGIGGRVKPLVNKAAKAERILVVDGCPLDCARHTLELAGFNKFEHLQLHQLGIRKGASPVNEERINTGIKAAMEILAREPYKETADGLQFKQKPIQKELAAA